MIKRQEKREENQKRRKFHERKREKSETVQERITDKKTRLARSECNDIGEKDLYGYGETFLIHEHVVGSRLRHSGIVILVIRILGLEIRL